MIWFWLVLPVAIPLFNTIANLFTWPSGKKGLKSSLKISVLIPARNEAKNIESCIEAAAQSQHPIDEIIVYNDGSTDGTGAILNRLKEQHPLLKVIEGTPLPRGWVGKPHACHQLANSARGDLLLFIDADTQLTAEGLSRIVNLLRHKGLDGQKTDIVSAMPHQAQHQFIEQLMMPMFHLTCYAWLPLIFTRWFQFPSMLAAVGQVMAIRRNCYANIGGFESVKGDIVDDLAICRLAKKMGHRVLFADGREIATCRMYTSADELWKGFSKNIYQAIGGSPLALLVLIVIHVLCFILPYPALIFGVVENNALLLPAMVGVVLNLLLRVVIGQRHQHTALSIVLHPLAVIGMIFISLNSFRWSHKGTILWRDRVYGGET